VTVELTEEGTSRYVQLADGKLHYNEAGSGHPVILIHGSGAGATGWTNFRANIPALAERFHVYALDMLGWGKSDPVPGGLYKHPEQLIEFMDAVGIEKAALVGNSMGGVISIATAARYPERVSHLITMGAAAMTGIPALFGFGDGPTEGIKILVQGYADPSQETMKKLVEIMAFSPEFATDELAALRAEAALAHPDHLANGLQAFRTGGPVKYQASPEEIKSITAPALLIHGRDDRVVHYEHTLRLVSMIPDSRAVLLNRCGHWAQIEHADEFNRLVADFVENN
jgi:2-hydroxy-6-oxonona-2,4-dienedioate hydrolase